MSSDHAHDHGRHAASERRVLWTMLLTGGFMLIEAAGGVLAGSLTLLADAGHMLTDTTALALSWYAFRASRQPPTAEHSYGHARFQVLAALVNGATLLAIAGWIAIEAAHRLAAPMEIESGTMLVVAAAGLLVNIGAFFILNGGERENLNIRGAMLHVLGDILGSIAAMAAALIILLTGWTAADPILSVLVALLIVRSAWLLVRQSWHVLMEGKPEGLDIADLKSVIVESVAGVTDVHHVHAWQLTPEQPLLTLHARISDGADHDQVLQQIRSLLNERFSIRHATIQVERSECRQ